METSKPYNIRHRAYQFSRAVILFIRDCRIEYQFSSLYDQLIRSATSVGANLVEGYAGSSGRDWQKFVQYALKSANETKYWLKLISDTMPVNKNQCEELMQESVEIANIIAQILINAKESKNEK